MRKRLLSRPAALAAAASLGMTGVLVTVPASATETAEEAPTSVKAMSKQVQEFDDVDGIQAYGTDGDGNVVVVTLPEEDLDADSTEALEAFEGDHSNVEVIEIGAPVQAYAQNELVGGAGYGAGTAEGAAGLCSVGFTAVSPEGNPAVITAGHCTNDDALTQATRTRPSLDTAHSGQDSPQLMDPAKIGDFAFSQFGGPNHSTGGDGVPNSTDIAVIDVTNPTLELLPAVTDWSTAGDDDLAAGIATEITGVSAPVAGAPVSKSGRTTGLTHDDDLDIADGYSRIGLPDGSFRWVRGFGVNGLEAAPGDSGGAVFQGDKAIGVVSGGSPASGSQESFFWGTSLVHALEFTDGYEVMVAEDDSEPTPDPTPSETPDPTPSDDPSDDPSQTPDPTPSDDPSDEPTEDPTSPAPTVDPTAPAPTDDPTDEAPVERELTIDPRRVTVTDFVNEDAGVNITATGYASGESVTLEVFPQNDSVNDFTLEGTADENGVVTFGVYGTNAGNADVYLGTYDVSVAATAGDDDAANAGSEAAGAAYAAGDADEPLTGSFEVVSDEGAAPGEDEDSDDNGSDLPRTGSELTGLGVGAGLLVVGAAAVYVTTRRAKKGQA